MANAAGFIQESIWRDGDWRKLSRSAQALYMQLLSQKELDCAGILPLQPHKWAKGCDELTVDDVWADLDELQGNRFVFYDIDTDECLVRTYMRNSNVIKSPNLRKAACKSAVLVGSAIIRDVLAAEMRAVGHLPELLETAEKLNPSGTLPEPLPEPFANRSKRTLPEPFPKPLPEPLPEGCGVGEGEDVSHVSENLGGGEPPRPQCRKHANGNPDDEPCRACKRQREWDEAHADDELNRKRTAREALSRAMHDCRVCDDDGWVLGEDGTPIEPAVKCQAHTAKEASHA